MNIKNFLLVLVITAISMTTGLGQFSGLDLLGGKKKVDVPFEYMNGFIVINVIYGGILSMNFLLDTGASHNILFKKNANDLLGYTYSDTIQIIGADVSEKINALVSRNVPIRLSTTEAINRDIIVLEEDYLDLEKMLGRRIDGILGGDFLKGLVLGINYKKQRLTIYDPNQFQANKKFTKHKLSIENYKPYLDLGTVIEDQKDTLRYLVDSGASLALLIHSNRIENFTLPENVIVGNLGKGIGGALTGYVGLTNTLEFMDNNFKNVVTSFQEIDSVLISQKELVRDGLIGNVILSRYHIILDYVNEYIYLKPTSKLNKEFSFDKSGMLIYAYGPELDQYFVKTVYPNSPASEAGVLPGDRIMKIGFWPLSFYSLADITNWLQGKEGRKVKLKLLRAGGEVKVSFRLRNLFKDKTDQNKD